MEVLEVCEKKAVVPKDLFRALYREVFPSVAQYIGKKGGTFEQAKDVFQDALIIYYEQVVCHEKVIKVSGLAYIFGVVKHLWNHQYRLGINYEPLRSDREIVDEVAGGQVSNERILALLTKAGDRCLKLLKAFYYDKSSMTELAKQFGFRSEHSATVQKFKCLEKIRSFIKVKSLHYEDFIE